MGCHKEREQDLPKITKETIQKDDVDNDHIIVCADPPMRCFHLGCHHYANRICAKNYCSEHHIEICHKAMSEVELQLECATNGK